jgi:hypothetical protein
MNPEAICPVCETTIEIEDFDPQAEVNEITCPECSAELELEQDDAGTLMLVRILDEEEDEEEGDEEDWEEAE